MISLTDVNQFAHNLDGTFYIQESAYGHGN